MKGKSESSAFFCSCRTFGLYKPSLQISPGKIIFAATIVLCFSSFSECQPNTNTSVVNGNIINGSLPILHFNSSSSPKPLSIAVSGSEEDYSDYYDDDSNNSTRNGNWRRHDHSKLAQCVVYVSVILIALGGILIKYFVTQYETSQIKAQEQLNYHRLHNQIA